MQEQKKVYLGGHAPIRWLSWLLIALSVLVILGGFSSRKEPTGSIEPLITATPYPLEESFDETLETCEWSLPQVEWTALQLGAFDSQESAQQLGQQYQKRGAAGYIWQDERYRVLAAIYANDTDARSVRQQISEQHEVESHLFQISLPSVKVSIHGMRGQIEILQVAFLEGADMITTLQSVCLASDRGEISREEQLVQLGQLNDHLQLIKQRLYQRFPQPQNACVAGLITLFDDYASFVGELHSEKAEVTYGAELKYQTIRSLDLLRQVYDILGNT